MGFEAATASNILVKMTEPSSALGASALSAHIDVSLVANLMSRAAKTATTVMTGSNLTILDRSLTLPSCFEGHLAIIDGKLGSPSKANEQKLRAIAAATLIEASQTAVVFRLRLAAAPSVYGAVEFIDLSGDKALLFGFVHPAHHCSPSMERLRLWFDLSPSEAAIALQVAQGLGLHQIAANRGLSLLTVRTHLRAVFDKMGVHKQRDLVALLIRLAAI